MNTTDYSSADPDHVWKYGTAVDSGPGRVPQTFGSHALTQLRRFFNLQREHKSILRNQTNLPMFVVVALGLTLLCNFTLRENTAEASRPVDLQTSIEKMLVMIRKSPDDHELHSQIAELYSQEKKYRRAMFHLAEASRLINRFGE